MSEWMNEWATEWLTECMNEWMNECCVMCRQLLTSRDSTVKCGSPLDPTTNTTTGCWISSIVCSLSRTKVRAILRRLWIFRVFRSAWFSSFPECIKFFFFFLWLNAVVSLTGWPFIHLAAVCFNLFVLALFTCTSAVNKLIDWLIDIFLTSSGRCVRCKLFSP